MATGVALTPALDERAGAATPGRWRGRARRGATSAAGALGADDVTSLATGFCHQVFLHADEDEYLREMTTFIEEGVRGDEAVLVAVPVAKIDLLRRHLGQAERDRVQFTDMAEMGANPARVMPAWADFARANGGRRLRGVGELIWAQRPADEVVECQRHEALLNVAFADHPRLTLLCSYDTAALRPGVVAEALRTHPIVRLAGRPPAESPHYPGARRLGRPFSAPLSEPPAGASSMDFDAASLSLVRSFVWHEAMDGGLGEQRASDALLAVNEAGTNSVRHGGGHGTLLSWPAAGAVIFEARDRGRMYDPLAGGTRPPPDRVDGRGLWMMNQLCDLVQIRSFTTGTTVRLHLRPHPA